MGNRPVAVLYEEQHLARPRFRRQRPAVAQDHGLSRAPILVVNLSAILGLDSAHLAVSFLDRLQCTRQSKSDQTADRTLNVAARTPVTLFRVLRPKAARAIPAFVQGSPPSARPVHPRTARD